MNVGNLYLAKKWFWLVFPTRATATDATDATDFAAAAVAADVGDGAFVDALAAYYSKQYKCNVTYFSPDSYIVFLEEEGKYKRVLTADGKVGWIWFVDCYNDCFEEVKAEE